MIEITDSPDIKQWSEFVYNHPYGNIFQTPEMAEVYRRTKNYEPISLAAIDDATNEILAVLLAVVIKEKSVLGYFSARSVIHGGPLFLNDKRGMDAVMILIEYYNKISRKKSLYTLVRNMDDTSEVSSIFNSAGYEYKDHLNYLIDLNLSINELWSRLHRSRRSGINRAKRRGVIIDEDAGEDAIPVIYELLKETYRNAKIPFADISLLQSIFNILKQKDMAKFFLAKNNDTNIGIRIILTYKDTIFDWYAGAPRKYSRLRPNDILAWHVIEWGSKNGYHIFDFGGAGNPNEKYGVREFKKQFGGEMVNFGRYVKIHSPIKMKIAEKGFNIYQKIFFSPRKLCIVKEG
jgi:lipid II:glycine glycyltransferase (peptidoglycan interpeptide bridge formation enzyme)